MPPLSSMQCPWLLLLLVVVVRSRTCDASPSAYVLLRVGGAASGVNHQVQFIVDAESNASNTLNSGYRGYNNGEGLVQNFEALNEEFGMASAPIAINQDHVLQSQSSGVNHQVQFIVDAESNATNTLNSGYRGYNNGEGLVQNFGALNEEFGMASAPIAINQDHVLQIERISSFEFEEYFNSHFSDELLFFDGQDKERTKNELSMVQDQSSGVNHQVQFIVDAESNASNTLNSGYRGYNNGNLVLNNMTRQVELNMENLYNQNFGVLDEEFGIAYAPVAIKQDHVLQSQSVVKNYEELPFDARIHSGFEGCTPEDCPELPNNLENDKRGETSTSTKQNLVADSPPTNESPGVLSKEERRKQSNRESQQRCRERKEARVNELEATAKLFNEDVKPLLLKILATDTGNVMYEVRKQLEDLIVKNQYAAIAFGIPASHGFKYTNQVAGAKMKRSHSIVRVGSCERLHKRRSGPN